MAEKKLQVMISSTVRDLEEYRAEAKDACLECGMFPDLMENRPAQDAKAIAASEKMVNESDVYLGIFAHRYGYTPTENNPSKISITEMEYNRAIAEGKPRLIFVIDEEHPFKTSLVDKGRDASKLARLKKRLTTDNVVKFFTTPDDLRAHIISALTELAQNLNQGSSKQGKSINIRGLPSPPEKYIAHPYTLLQTHHLVGRKAELGLLNDWVSNPASDVYREHILSFVAIGGLGKSALTWKWFDEFAPKKMEPLAGRMWWSFYDRDAYFENFILHALAYVSDSPVEVAREIPAPEREIKLLAALNEKPFLLVLDGFERELIAYARIDASRLEDSEVDSHGNLRKTVDPRVGQFLKKLAQVEKSRILISTRLQPAELETDAGKPSPGVFRYNLDSLPDDDAVELWQALGVEGSRSVMLPVFRSFGKHTLLIQTLSGEIVNYRRGPGNFDKWREANPRFDPTKFKNLKDRMAHVLEFALARLDNGSQNVLNTISAFKMPTGYETLTAILVGNDKDCADEKELDDTLKELENRGLVGWDKRANRYDLHPVVRGVVWSGLSDDARQRVFTSLHTHFKVLPMLELENIESLEDLTPAIELYNILIGLKRYDDACVMFYDQLNQATLYRLGVSRQRVELLEMLFPNGVDKLSQLSQQDTLAFALDALAQGYQFSGQLSRAVTSFQRANIISSETKSDENLIIGLENLANSLLLIGRLRECEASARQELVLNREKGYRREGGCLLFIGLAFALRGYSLESGLALKRSLRVAEKKLTYLPYDYLALRSLWFGNFEESITWLEKAMILCESWRYEQGIIRVFRIQGEVTLGLNRYVMADERLHHALTRARAINLVEEELPTLAALAELRRRQGDEKAAREFLDDVWEFAERGPYPTFHADALNVLAQIERDTGNTEEAVRAAAKAYELSWCDGPPYAYHWGFEKAKQHLNELGAPPPEMEPFDESRYDPMPEVEIDPNDEFHVGEIS
jgi:tetratricopeptide (TPR) repeat protein